MLQLVVPQNKQLGGLTIKLGFPRYRRLLKPDEFKRVFGKAKKVASGPFIILACPNQREYPRLGVVLSKKKIPKAVQRNRIRRLIRECFRKQTALGGVDFVVLPKPGIDVLSNAQLEKGLLREWQQYTTWSSNRSLP
ncbi:MAG TPA: ribonuclease P protein component [Gammaproteobacteria bacterium]|nr:ribonuclease P protein component [Gammaproteobacteria bacterium]